MRRAAAPLLAAVLAGCATPPPATVAAYQCSGQRVEAGFAGEAVDVRLDGTSHRLPQTRSASGARYEAGSGAGRILFWDRGDRARLEVGARTFPECRRLSPVTDARALQGREWVVEDIAGRGVIDVARATLRFGEDGRIAGQATCNSYSGTYTLAGAALAIGPLAATRKACPPALMDQEAAVLAVLSDARSAELTADGALVLTAADGTALTARR